MFLSFLFFFSLSPLFHILIFKFHQITTSLGKKGMVQDEIKYRLVLRSAEVSLWDSLRKVTDHGCRFVGDFKREREDSSDPKTAPETQSDLKSNL